MRLDVTGGTTFVTIMPADFVRKDRFMNVEKRLITWRSEEPAGRRPCAACGETSEMPAVLTTMRSIGGADITFYRCERCHSLNGDGDFDNFEEMADLVWDQYLQIGAAPSSMFRPLDRAGLVEGGSLLDIGCGYGFTLDYWERVARGRAIGLEPAGYADRGISDLGVRILKKYLSNAEEVKGRKFDRIFSSEVIEHVPDPSHFLKELKSFLQDDGIAILTTPNADFVRPGNSPSIVRSVLSPGLHQFVLSQSAFEDLLSKAGFKHHIVDVENERLFAYASDNPLNLTDDRAAQIENVFTYLRSRASDSPPGSSLGLGARYRLFRDFVNLGRLDEAQGVGHELLDAIRSKYGFDPLDVDACRSRVFAIRDPQAYGDAAPFFLPCLLFYVGMLAVHGRKLGDTPPEQFFHCSAELCGDVQKVFADGALEAAALYWVSVYEEGARRLAIGDHARALSLFDSIMDGAPADEPHLLFCGRPESLIDRAMIQSGVVRLQTSRPEEAMVLFRSAIDRIGPEGDLGLANEAFRLWREAQDLAPRIMPAWLPNAAQGSEVPSARGSVISVVSRILGRR